MSDYAGPFNPLPATIRARHPDMIGWEFDKTYPTLDRWQPNGWHVVTPGGIVTYDLHGLCVRDRTLYA